MLFEQIEQLGDVAHGEGELPVLGAGADILVEVSQAEKVIEELYIRCLTRTPTKAEVDRLVATVREASDRSEALADLFWAVLNSREFMFNH